jgi:hypothetical protein
MTEEQTMAENQKTPLQQLQNEVADYLGPNTPAITQAALDAFLVQAFDLGATAQRELAEDVAALEKSPELRAARASFDETNRRRDEALEKMVRKD